MKLMLMLMNTLFHAAASKGYTEIVEVLLEHANSKEHTKLIELINTRTTAGGSIPLYVAAKTDSYEIVISLLFLDISEITRV